MNIADKLTENAKRYPSKKAVMFPKKNKGKNSYNYDYLTFRQLENLTNYYVKKLIDDGFTRGKKTLLFVRPSLDFSALTFALFKIGIVPILIDPGMGRKNLLKAISESSPDALIAEPEVHFIRLFCKSTFKTVKHFITTGGFCWGKMNSLKKIKKDFDINQDIELESENISPNETAAILFTSGGTGIPKGVVYTHKIFSEQTRILQELFSLNENDVDIPGFPLFSLFTIAMGMTSAIPDMDPSRPSKANPESLVKNINDTNGTFVAGSPSIWINVANYCIKNDIQLPSVKSLVMFGAPVSNELHEKFLKILPNGTTYTPYGATESLPVACISGKDVLSNTSELTKHGKGTCVGHPVPHTNVKIIKVSDSPIDNFNNIEELPPYQVGEIIVSGDVVTKQYYNMENETKKAKIYEAIESDQKTVWHRIGDMGYLDAEGRLWFCGRKTHRIESYYGTLYSVQCESIFNQHPEVKRSALIEVKYKGLKNAAIVIENKGKKPKGILKTKFETELSMLSSKYDHTKKIKHIFYHDNFPVDVRHNIKIDRIKLRNMFKEMIS